MSERLKPAGYLIVHQDWYEDPEEQDPLRRNARVTSLSPRRFTPDGAQLVKRCYEVMEITESTPVEFTIGEGRPIGQAHYETLESAQDYLRELGIANPQVGFNPIE